MEDHGLLYGQFFKAQRRFLNARQEPIFDPEIVHDYVHWGRVMGGQYEPGSANENLLLCELFLRQLYFHLLEAMKDKKHKMVFRRVCYDAIHPTLICLKRYYYHFDNGDVSVNKLIRQLRLVVAQMDC